MNPYLASGATSPDAQRGTPAVAIEPHPSLVHKAVIKSVRKHTSPKKRTKPIVALVDNREAEEEFRRRQVSGFHKQKQ